MFSMTMGFTEISIEMVLEMFPKFPSEKIGYDVEGKRDGSRISVEMRVCIWISFFSPNGMEDQ